MSVATATNSERIKQVKADLVARGVSQADFARDHGLDYNTMQMVLQGRLKGTRGEAHRVMVALGLKKDMKKEVKRG
ncbi:DNA-binding protein [Limnohabitans sp.]|uniref:DNA-binding protein n=1 Tax=Limnohabitans sp. TaxID=1907725 RepID=UPI00286EC071|nr:DNA-binding protein [Limnohabitans sp.]